MLELIYSVRLDCRKDIQSVKSVWSVFNTELKAPSYPLFRGIIIMDVKRTLTYMIIRHTNEIWRKHVSVLNPRKSNCMLLPCYVRVSE